MSDEEDYMSDSFLATIPDVRPGLPVPHAARYQRDKMSKQISQKNPKDVLVEGLNTKLPPTNKGFAMMAKMGYKENTGLGLKGDGRVEPVEISIGNKRKGVGLDSHKVEKKRVIEDAVHKEFKMATTERFVMKKIRSNLNSIQSTCYQLDKEKWDLIEPLKPGFWPKTCLPQKNDDAEEVEESSIPDEDESRLKDYTPYRDPNEEEDAIAEVTVEEEEEEEFDPVQQLSDVSEYLRRVHFYCFWCGVQYMNPDELSSQCPGITEEDHD